MTFKRFYILIVMALISMSAAAAPSITISAKLDSVNLRMGRMTSLHLSVSQPAGVKGHFPVLKDIKEDGIIPVCGDSVELRAPQKIDTVQADGRLQINLDIPVQSFDSGYYRLPGFAFVVGNDSVFSNSLALKVYPVNATADTPIGDFASTADPENPSIFDYLPDWMVELWWLWIIIIAAIVVFIYAMRRYRREGSLLPKKPEPTPYEKAISGLRELKQQQLWESGQEKEYYTQLTDILRQYLYGRFGINASEMTSRQILAALSKNKELTDKRVYFRQILDMADFVKFAKVRPLPDDNVLAFDNAMRFVEETKPKPPVEEESDAQTKKGGAK